MSIYRENPGFTDRRNESRVRVASPAPFFIHEQRAPEGARPPLRAYFMARWSGQPHSVRFHGGSNFNLSCVRAVRQRTALRATHRTRKPAGQGIPFSELVSDATRSDPLVGYKFDLLTNTLAAGTVPNPGANRAHSFRAWRLKGESARQCVCAPGRQSRRLKWCLTRIDYDYPPPHTNGSDDPYRRRAYDGMRRFVGREPD